MRRVIALLASLYPRAWRERYGEEFTALLEDLDPSPRAALNVFTGAITMQMKTWNYGWMLAISAFCAMTAFAAEYLLVPGRYVSEGVLMTTGYADSQQALDAVFRLTQNVESRATLAGVISSEHLYERERTREPLMDVIDRMRRDIRIMPTAAGVSAAFKVSFIYPDAKVSQRATQVLISRFVEQAFGSGVTVQVVDPPSYPTEAVRSLAKLASLALVLGLFVLSALLLLRRRALKSA